MPIRLRMALVFALALAIAFALGGWLFLSQLSAATLRSTDSALAARLNQVGHDPEGETGPVAAVTPGGPAPGEYVAQVVDASNRVRRASAHAGKAPLLTEAELSQARRHEIVLTRTIDHQPVRLLAAPLREEDGWVGIVGLSLAASDGTLRQVTAGLFIGGAAFVILAGIGAYWLARAALAPVERLRREAATLSEDDTGATLRVPGTHDEIAALAGTMNDLLLRLRRALARQRAFVADASHELRTPFAVLHGELELAGRPGRSRDELTTAVASAANGVRSSWLASATKARCRASARRKRSSRSFMVPASAAISSCVPGSRSVAPVSCSDSAAASRLSRSTGASAALASQ